jgi:hypothetical protein
MSAKFRMGQVMAGDVAAGDTLLDVPYGPGGLLMNQARTLGVVLHVQGDETRRWLIETSSGAIKEWPEEPVGRYVNTYVHVPWTPLPEVTG